MTRTFASARRSVSIRVEGPRVIVRETRGRHAFGYARSFPNRYTLRKFLSETIARVEQRGLAAA